MSSLTFVQACVEGRLQEYNRQECERWGHDLDIAEQAGTQEPRAAVCGNGCGHRWVLIPADQPHLWQVVAPAVAGALRSFPGAVEAVNAAVHAALESGGT